MSTNNATPAPAEMSVSTQGLADKVLTDLQVASKIVAGSGSLIPGAGLPIALGAGIVNELVSIIQAARAAHQKILGQPLDMSLLKDEPPVT